MRPSAPPARDRAGVTRPPRVVRRSTRLAAGTAVTALLLAGCADQPLPAPQPQEVPAPSAAVTGERLALVHEQVAADAAEADAAGDVALLEPRVTGVAAEVREARYRLAELLPGTLPPVPLGGEVLRDVVPAVGTPGAEEGTAPERAVSPAEASATFPRTWMAVTQAPDAPAPPPAEDGSEDEAEDVAPAARPLPQLSVLVQDDARSPYRVVATTSLLPGATVPAALAPDVGAPAVAVDAGGLVMTPEEAVARYGAALGDPEAPEGEAFAPDAFRDVLLAERAEDDALDFFALETSRGVRPGAVTATATADGGSLVVGVLESESVQTVEEEGALLPLTGPVAALADAEEAGGSLSVRWLEVVALAVPAAPADGEDAEAVQVVGADRVLVGAEAS